MKILRVNMTSGKVTFEELSEEWKLLGGRGLIAKIMNKEVPPDTDPLGANNKLIIAGGALAGTIAPQLGRISVGGKSPLTLGIKEANSGGPAAQKLDKLGIRAIVVEGMAPEGTLYSLKVSRDGAVLTPADKFKGMKNYPLAEELLEEHGKESSIISIGPAGERKYKSASVTFTDALGDPSRNAARGGLGAVMGSKGLKAVIIDDSGTPPVAIADKELFKQTVKSWVDTIGNDMGCGFFSKFGTPYAVSLAANQGTMPALNYTSGRPERFLDVSGEFVRRKVWERGGKMHGCMPGCVVRCSIVYNDQQGKHMASGYEYEAIALLGTNLGIDDPDAVARLKFICDDLGVDLIEIGSALGVAASAGKMKMGDVDSAIQLLNEIEQGTGLGRVLADGVVSTARAFKISRIPAFKGQAIPGHDPRAVKATGVTYATSPMGADHTAGVNYRNPLQKGGQAASSLRSQIQAATCDTFGYCVNSIPGKQASVYVFLADLVKARYGLKITADDVFEIGKQTLRDELKFNEGAEFNKIYERYPAFVRTEPLSPTNSVFDVEDAELDSIWGRLGVFTEPKKNWEIRFPAIPTVLLGVCVFEKLGEQAKSVGMKKTLVVGDTVMKSLGRLNQAQELLKKSGIASALFADVEPDPSVELVEKGAASYREAGCDSLIAIGGGSSIDTAKGIAVRVSQTGVLTEYESVVGGVAKMKPPVPPIICLPTTSGTGSEMNQYAVITNRCRNNFKFPMMNSLILPKVAIIDPLLCRTMPPAVTADTGIDALSHCIESYVAMSETYHPYYDALALHGVKLVGKSLRAAYKNGDDIAARTDMCMAAAFGGVALSKGLCIGHAISHVLGSYHHIPHGRGCALGLLCFVRANKKVCAEQFTDLAYALDRSPDLEEALIKLYKDLDMPLRLREVGLTENDLKRIAFEAFEDVVQTSPNPTPLTEYQILQFLKESF